MHYTRYRALIKTNTICNFPYSLSVTITSYFPSPINIIKREKKSQDTDTKGCCQLVLFYPLFYFEEYAFFKRTVQSLWDRRHSVPSLQKQPSQGILHHREANPSAEFGVRELPVRISMASITWTKSHEQCLFQYPTPILSPNSLPFFKKYCSSIEHNCVWLHTSGVYCFSKFRSGSPAWEPQKARGGQGQVWVSFLTFHPAFETRLCCCIICRQTAKLTGVWPQTSGMKKAALF